MPESASENGRPKPPPMQVVLRRIQAERREALQRERAAQASAEHANGRPQPRPHPSTTRPSAQPFASSGSSSTSPVLDERRKAAWLSTKLDAYVEELSATPEGSRNDLLNTQAYTLGGYVAGEGLDEQLVHDALRTAALRAGLTISETDTTLASGLRDGQVKPLRIELEDRVLATPELDAGAHGTFWAARPLLQHVFDYARARRVSPWATLGVVLCRVVASTEPTLVLPPLVGGYASLNYFVGLVGTSGAGKGGAERVASELLHWGYTGTATVGSGEGIAHSYKRRKRGGELEEITSRMIFSVPEVDTLAAVGARQGATLLPELRRAWSGEALGFAYADPAKRLPVPEHSYRLALILGIQPARAKTLLDDIDGGTPQRFLWLPAIDHGAPAVAPAVPPVLSWSPPRPDMRHDVVFGRKQMQVCEIARKTIDEAALARLRGDGDALDGHLLLTHLKTAAALALLDGRLDVSDEDWQLADTVMGVSLRTRTVITETLSRGHRTANRAKAEGDAERSLIVDEKRAEEHEQRAAQRVLTMLKASDEPMQRKVLRAGVRANYRHAFDEALKALIATGQVVGERDPKGNTRYALARR